MTKSFCFCIVKFMDRTGFLKQSKLDKKSKKAVKEELINFVGFQFKQLTKKHLRIPIQMYQL